MRIVTRPDFDGVVSAVLLGKVEEIDGPIHWVQPSDMQKGRVEILPGDIVANLPFDRRCTKWFDHHFTNEPEESFEGAYDLAPSAARVIYNHYGPDLGPEFAELVDQADKIDAADLSMEEVMAPEKHPWVILSMTVSGSDPADEPYWNHLVRLLGEFHEIGDVMSDPEVARRCQMEETNNRSYKKALTDHTHIQGRVAVTDFRSFDPSPQGNRFLVYSLFSEAVVHMNMRWAREDRSKMKVSLGHSIFNRNCRVNVGRLLSGFEGGGHRAAASCIFDAGKADDYLPRILDVLLKNESE